MIPSKDMIRDMAHDIVSASTNATELENEIDQVIRHSIAITAETLALGLDQEHQARHQSILDLAAEYRR